MAKANFGEYAAFHTQGGIRFMKNSKLTSVSNIPTEVIAYLKKSLGEDQAQIVPPPARFPMPTEAEKRKLLADSLKVKPELQAAVTTPLTPEDFDVPVPVPEVPEVTTITETFPEPDARPVVETPLSPIVDAAIDLEAISDHDHADFLESVSIHTAPLQDLAEALYARFGIYTVYKGALPNMDEINPLTGEVFTKYHLGIAYQAAIRAANTGLLNRPAEEGRRLLDEGRYASANLPLDAPVTTMGQARRENTYDYRTSPQGTQTVAQTEIVHVTGADGVMRAEQRVIPEGETGQFNGASARYDADEDQPLVQPNFSGKPIIRPNW